MFGVLQSVEQAQDWIRLMWAQDTYREGDFVIQKVRRYSIGVAGGVLVAALGLLVFAAHASRHFRIDG